MSKKKLSGSLQKMRVVLCDPVEYFLILGDQELPLNAILGKYIELEFPGLINCIHCHRKTSKSFNQGYCFPCFRKLAQCDLCIVSPEKCHYEKGTCREPDWADIHCMTEHIVYLSMTSGIKVGITRASQVPTRWIDQGATQAQPVFRVNTRYQSGLMEKIFSDHVKDKTNWRVMLKGNQPSIDLGKEVAKLIKETNQRVDDVSRKFEKGAVRLVNNAEETTINYPVLEFPEKISSLNPDKNPIINGRLMGIKGQYLILDSGVINLRKYGGYKISFAVL